MEANYDSEDEVISKVSDAEIIVGIPSKNSAHTINYVIKNATEGLKKYFSNFKYYIIVCDGLSNDGTVDVVKAYRKYLEAYVFVIPNLKSNGKGGAVKTLIDLASLSNNLKYLILLDSDLRSITPEWIPLLACENYDFIAPYYIRNRYDATITNFVARPLTVATYGVDVRQPIGGDFGLSYRLVRNLSGDFPWKENPWSPYFGVDILITHTALASELKICQAYLGAKIHEAKDPSSLKGMFKEVTGSIYYMLKIFEDKWYLRRFTEPNIVQPTLIRKPEVPKVSPPEVRVNKELSAKLFNRCLTERKYFIEKVLGLDLSRISVSNGLGREAWVKALINGFKVFIKANSNMRNEILETLFGLWQGRLLKYYNDVKKLSDAEIEKYLNSEVSYMVTLRNKLIR